MNRILLSFWAIIAIFIISFTRVYATQHTVSNTQELLKSINIAQWWDVINLLDWEYWDITVYNKNYSSPVTIMWEESDAILGQTKIVKSSNIVFENINFVREKKETEKNYTPIITITSSSNIELWHNTITSSDDNDTSNDMTWISWRANNNVDIHNNSFSNLYKAISSIDTTSLEIDNNTFDIISVTWIQVGRNSINSTISDNTFKNFYRCNTSSPKTCTSPWVNISIWNNNGTKNLDNMSIIWNVSLIWEWSFSQFVIAKSNNTQYPISNITIADNTLYNNHINWFYLNNIESWKIENNSLIQWNISDYNLASNSKKPYIRVFNSDNVSVTKNVAFGIQNKNNTNSTDSQNIKAQRTDSSKNTHIAKLIHNDTAWIDTTLENLAPKKWSILDLWNDIYIGSQWYYDQEVIVIEPKIYPVEDNASFLVALNTVQAWDSIILDNWNYWDILIYGKVFEEWIKIQSKNTGKAIIEKLQVTSSSHIHFQGITFSHERRDNEYDWSKIVYLNQSSNISIHHSEFVWSDDWVFTNDIEWFGAKSSHNLHLSNNEFHNLEKGAVFDDTHSVIFASNSLHNIAVDWVAFWNNAVNIDISNNSFTNFRPCDIFDTNTCKKHPDFIQMWNNNWTQANENITISNNSLIRWEGWVTQWILIQANNATHQNKNFTISDNTINTSHIHGISVIDWDNITVKDNTVTTSETPVTSTMNPNIWTINPRIRFYNITSGTISNNETNWIDVINSDNTLLQNNIELLK